MRPLLTTLLLFGATAHAVPSQFTQQGRLLDGDGEALSGDATITFRVTDSETGGTALWEETLTLPLTNGFYAASLGADEDNPLDTAVLDQVPVWLELQIEGEGAMFPRSPIHAVPYATMATVAEEVFGGPVDASQIAVDGIPVVNDAGEWVGPTPAVNWSELEGVPAGFADGIDDDTHTDTDSFADLGISCTDGAIPVWDSVAMEWVCDFDQDTLAAIACLDGQLIQWNDASVGWVCANDADTVLSEEAVDAMVSDNGYGLATAIFSGRFSDLTDVPVDLADGDDDTQLTADEVDDIVSDKGYARTADLFSGDFSALSGVPAGLSDGDTTLTEAEVDDMVSDNSYAMAADVFSGSFDDLSGVPDGVGQPLPIEPFSLSLSSNVSSFRDGFSFGGAVPVFHGFFSNSEGRYTKLQVRTEFVDTSASVWFGLYDDLDGRPGNLVSSVNWTGTADDSDKLTDISWVLYLEAQKSYHLMIMNFSFTKIYHGAEPSIISMRAACDDGRYTAPPSLLYVSCGWIEYVPFWFRLLP
jgi:hypothetical protein